MLPVAALLDEEPAVAEVDLAGGCAIAEVSEQRRVLGHARHERVDLVEGEVVLGRA